MLDIVENVQCIDFCKNSIRSINGHLTAIAAVCLVAVVLCRVVAGSYHDTSTAMQCTNGKRQHRGWLQFGVDVNLYPICSEDFRSSLCKVCGLNSAVVGNCNAWFGKCFFYIVRQTLSCFANSIDVHTIGASTNYATQTACSKSKIPIKTVLNGFCIVFNGRQFRL